MDHIAHMVKKEHAENEGKKPLSRPRHRWYVNIKDDLREMECEDIDCIQLAQDRVHLVGFCEHNDKH